MAKITREALLDMLDSLRDSVARGESFIGTVNISSSANGARDQFELSGSYSIGENKVEGLAFLLNEATHSSESIAERHRDIIAIFRGDGTGKPSAMELALEEADAKPGFQS